MKASALWVVVGLSVIGTQAAFAQTVTAEMTVIDAAAAITRIRNNQAKLCLHPRTKNAVQCVADFDALVPKVIEFASWQALSTQTGRATQEASEYRKKAVASKEVMLKASRQLEQDYYPLQTTGSLH